MSIADEITRLKNAKESIKTAIKNKGVEVSDSLTISDYAELIEDISQGNEDFIKGLIECTSTEIIIPNYVTKIGYGFFASHININTVIIPNSVTSIGSSAFTSCTGLKTIVFPNSISSIDGSCFNNCNSLNNVIIPENISRVDAYSFYRCTALTDLTILAKNASFHVNAFAACNALENVILCNEFNGSGLNLSHSTKYTAETIVGWLEALADRTGLSAYTLTIGTTNLAKLTEEQIAIATSKNWTLA